MCFSAEADIVTGLVVTGVGVGTLRHVGHDREATVAALPIVLGLHQLIEVPVWWGFDGRVSAGLADGAAWLYLAIAFGIVPVAVPYAVHRLEADPRRRRLMGPLIVLGAIVAIVLMIPVLTGSVSTTDGGNYIAYSANVAYAGPMTVLYVAATCGSLLLSSDRVVAIYGVVNLVTVGTLAVLLTSGVISLWCVWAAVTSIAIAIHLRRLHRRHAAGPGVAGRPLPQPGT